MGGMGGGKSWQFCFFLRGMMMPKIGCKVFIPPSGNCLQQAHH
jgi:hypothetical protein